MILDRFLIDFLLIFGRLFLYPTALRAISATVPAVFCVLCSSCIVYSKREAALTPEERTKNNEQRTPHTETNRARRTQNAAGTRRNVIYPTPQRGTLNAERRNERGTQNSERSRHSGGDGPQGSWITSQKQRKARIP